MPCVSHIVVRMTYELLIALVAFAFVTSITPGPNNLMLMASGANFGWRRTVPHMLGISIGFMVLLVLVGVGLIRVFDAFPVIYTVLKGVSIGFLGYLAYKIATSAPPGQADDAATGKPMSFMQAALFQWVNPKAWAMVLSAISAYTPQGSGVGAIVIVALVFGAVNLPTINAWVFLGTQMRRLLNVRWKLRAFNLAAAGLLLASLYPILFG